MKIAFDVDVLAKQSMDINWMVQGKDFANWGEVIRRVEVYGDKFIADNLRGTKASLDGVTLYLACTPSTKKFLKSSAVAIPRIKQQCRNVIGYGVEVKIIDL